MNTFLAQSDAASAVAGGAGIFAIGAVIIAITWTVFPFIVISKFNRILRGMEMILHELRNPRPKP